MTPGAASDDPNLAQLGVVAAVLGELCASLVFVGGCATGLLVTAARAQRIRVTADVDLVAEVATARAYHNLRARTTKAVEGSGEWRVESGEW